MSKPGRHGAAARRVAELRLVGVASLLWVVVGALVLTVAYVGPGEALAWGAVAATVTAGELAYLRRHGDVALDGGRAEGSLGVANALTLVRGGLYAAVAGFVTVPPTAAAWGPAACYGVGVALDALDGWVARNLGRTTRLGERLDLAFDTLGFVVAPVVAVVWGQLPAWYLSLSAARYVFRAGVAWRRRRGRPVHDLPESRVRRPLAAFQMAFVTVALTPAVGLEAVRLPAALALAASLSVFGRDYLAVSGRLGGRGAV
ncbi:MAG: CDP-alcohol phosphatidyltransferase family protein [Haloferacaceae archaeon]